MFNNIHVLTLIQLYEKATQNFTQDWLLPYVIFYIRVMMPLLRWHSKHLTHGIRSLLLIFLNSTTFLCYQILFLDVQTLNVQQQTVIIRNEPLLNQQFSLVLQLLLLSDNEHWAHYTEEYFVLNKHLVKIRYVHSLKPYDVRTVGLQT